MKSRHETTLRSSTNSAPKFCPPTRAPARPIPAKQSDANSNSPAPIRPLRRDRNRNGSDIRRLPSAARTPQAMSAARAPFLFPPRHATTRPWTAAAPSIHFEQASALPSPRTRPAVKAEAHRSRVTPHSRKSPATNSERRSADLPALPPRKYDSSLQSQAADKSASPCPLLWAIALRSQQSSQSRQARV